MKESIRHAEKTAVLIVVCLCLLPVSTLGGGELAKKSKARLDAAENAYKAWTGNPPKRLRPSDMVYQLSVRWLNAELDHAKDKKEQIVAYSAHLQRMRDWGKSLKSASAIYPTFESCEKEAEYWLEKANGEKSTPPAATTEKVAAVGDEGRPMIFPGCRFSIAAWQSLCAG